MAQPCTAFFKALRDRFRLPAFRNAETEAAFWAQHDAEMLPIRFPFLLLSAFIFLLLAGLDMKVGGENADAMAVVRVIAFVMLVSVSLRFGSPRSSLYGGEVLLTAYALVFVTAAIIHIVLAPVEAVVQYHFALGVIMGVGGLVLVPRLSTMKTIFTATVAIYLITMPWYPGSTVTNMVNGLYNLLIAGAVLVGGFSRERLARLQAVSGENLVRMNLDLEKSRSEALGARDTAIAANRAKNVFLASVSHELRTPMNAILGFSDMIRSKVFGPVGEPRYEEYIEHIHSSGTLLQANIDDLLDLARLDSGKLGWENSVFPLEDVVDKVLATCRINAQNAGVALVIDQPVPMVMVEADPSRIAQALINLVTNAVKFTDSGGQVRLVTTMNEVGGCSIRVTDTGCGMSPEDLEKVRLPFAQVHQDSYSKGKGGLGLGLAIVSGIVDTMGGTLDLQSEQNVGTVATFVIPTHRVMRSVSDAA